MFLCALLRLYLNVDEIFPSLVLGRHQECRWSVKAWVPSGSYCSGITLEECWTLDSCVCNSHGQHADEGYSRQYLCVFIVVTGDNVIQVQTGRLHARRSAREQGEE